MTFITEPLMVFHYRSSAMEEDHLWVVGKRNSNVAAAVIYYVCVCLCVLK